MSGSKDKVICLAQNTRSRVTCRAQNPGVPKWYVWLKTQRSGMTCLAQKTKWYVWLKTQGSRVTCLAQNAGVPKWYVWLKTQESPVICLDQSTGDPRVTCQKEEEWINLDKYKNLLNTQSDMSSCRASLTWNNRHHTWNTLVNLNYSKVINHRHRYQLSKSNNFSSSSSTHVGSTTSCALGCSDWWNQGQCSICYAMTCQKMRSARSIWRARNANSRLLISGWPTSLLEVFTQLQWASSSWKQLSTTAGGSIRSCTQPRHLKSTFWRKIIRMCNLSSRLLITCCSTWRTDRRRRSTGGTTGS